MLRIPALIAILGAAALTVPACNLEIDADDFEEFTDNDSDVTGQAVVTGHIDASIEGEFKVYVNDSPRRIVVDSNGTFVIRDVPSGTVTIGCEVAGIRGNVQIDGVAEGELIEVSIRLEGTTVVVSIDQRTQPGAPPKVVENDENEQGTPLEIRDNNACVYLDSGTHRYDVVILGNNVKLIGDASCEDRTVIEGNVTIKGNNATVFDLEVRGALAIEGNNAYVSDSCRGCVAAQCATSCADNSGGNACSGGGGNKDDKDQSNQQ